MERTDTAIMKYESSPDSLETDHEVLLEKTKMMEKLMEKMSQRGSTEYSGSYDSSNKSTESFETSLPENPVSVHDVKKELLGKSKCGVIILVDNATDSCNNSISSSEAELTIGGKFDRGKLMASYEQGNLKLLDGSRSGSLEVLDSAIVQKITETTKLTKGEEEQSCWKRHRLCVQRMVALIAACGCFAIIGALMTFTEYANALKAKFQLRQLEVEIIMSTFCFAGNLGYPAGLMGEKLGTQKTLGIAMILVVGNYLLLWSTQYTVDFHTQHSWLFYIYFFLLGIGGCFGFIPVIPVMINNFKPSQYGCVTGFMFSFFFVGPAVYSAIYGALFINGHVYDEAKQDLNGFFLLCAVSSFVLYLLAFIFVRPVEQDAPVKEEQMSQLVSSFSINSFSLQNIPLDTPDLTGCALFRLPAFQLLLWPTIFMNSVQQTFMNNTSAYLKSYKHQSYITLVAILAPVIGTVANIIIGLLSDYTAPRFPRIAYQIILNSLQAILLVLCLFYMENIVLFLLTTIITTAAFSGMLTISPTILTEISGALYYGRNIGGMYLGQGIGIVLLQTALGLFYDANANAEGNCYGLHCFHWSFLIALILTIISIILQCVNLYVLRFRLASSRKRKDVSHRK